MSDPSLIASVDCGSNSFRLLVARVVETSHGKQIYPLDSLKETVRLAAGLSKDKMLDDAAFERGLTALARFGERLRSFHPEQVRAVATNTLRVAKNAPLFLRQAEDLLGFPLEVIAGREEARLVYVGVAHALPMADENGNQGRRLVVDIGGGSTEFVIGRGYEPELMESLYLGCVSWSRNFFRDGEIDRHGLKEAELAAQREIQVISRSYRQKGWEQAVGSAGTANALAELIQLNNLGNGATAPQGVITREGMDALRAELLRAGNVNKLKLDGLKPDRLPVLAGGFAIMNAVFAELELERMQTCDNALRLGVMYDLIGRGKSQDMRVVTVAQFQERYSVDRAQAARVGELAVRLFQSTGVASGEELDLHLRFLRWAGDLHEVGLSISHAGYHKHSAYIVGNADMPGFSKREQADLATLTLGHAGKLPKLRAVIEGRKQSRVEWTRIACLRLAVLLFRRRVEIELPPVSLALDGNIFVLGFDGQWLDAHPLTDYTLEQEMAEWDKVGFGLKVKRLDQAS
ncbi:exopolyphosphatase [Derxia lacustris]|uniref:exopolyphosphatase n=1 Tax=Derxia lacustris TaxID=764842 RepID=UPI000A175649|nr:exopolyphosphatase [Derxia lacustris]